MTLPTRTASTMGASAPRPERRATDGRTHYAVRGLTPTRLRGSISIAGIPFPGPCCACSAGRLSPVLPKRFADREEVAAVRTEADELEPGADGDQQHRLAGRVLARRDMGKLMFLDLVDRSGRIQLLVRPDEIDAPDIDLVDVVGVTGVAT